MAALLLVREGNAPPEAVDLPPGCELVTWLGPTPPTRLDAMARLLGFVYDDVTPDLLREQEQRTRSLGVEELTVAASAGGDLVGYTDLAWDPAEPSGARLGGTAVDPEWRQRGLATALKVGAMRSAYERWPEIRRLTTENDGDNDAIVRCNRSLGFVVVSPAPPGPAASGSGR